MQEKIVHIEKSKRAGKKYMVIVRNLKTKKERVIHFGASDYQQFKDSTKLKKFSKKNHGDKDRRRRYFLRHSNKDNKREAIVKELKKSRGKYNAKILSHIYLW